MFETLKQNLQKEQIISHMHQNILVAPVASEEEGIKLVSSLLYSLLDMKTMLYLSGGKTPKNLYDSFAREENFFPAAVGLIDERYGFAYHENSNEQMLRQSGLLRYFQIRDIPFYPVLESEIEREQAAEDYDDKVRSLHSTFQTSIGLLGIGLDGHTAGIAGNRPDFNNPLFDSSRKNLLVSEFNDQTGMFKERITMTFLGLSMLDILIVLVFGNEKQNALKLLFSEGSEEEIPSRFYKRPDIAQKTLLITDQQL